jgi:hypothetical protein
MSLLVVQSSDIPLRPTLKSFHIAKACTFTWFVSVAISAKFVNVNGLDATNGGTIDWAANIALKVIPPFALACALYASIAVPSELAHLPRAPFIPILLSFLRGEPDDVRYRQQILPLLDEQGHGVVLVWMLGRWIVHVLDWRLGRAMAETTALEKQIPEDGMLLWDLIGHRNFIFANGALWKRHAAVIKRGFEGPVPMDVFTHQSRALFNLMGPGGRLHAKDWAQRYALAVVGSA